MGKVLRAGLISPGPIAAGYIGHWHGMQAATDTSVVDRSGRGNNLTKTAGATWDNNGSTGVWSTANYFSSHESATAYWVELANTIAREWDYSAGDSLILAFRALLTTPAATTHFIGSTGTANPGLALRVYQTSGLVDLRLCFGSTPTVLTLPAAGGLATAWASGSPSESHYAIAIDGKLHKAYAFKDGVVDNNMNGLAIGDGVTNYDFRPAVLGTPFRFGGGGSTNGTNSSFRDVHMIRKPAAGFRDIQRAINFLAFNKFLRFPNALI